MGAIFVNANQPNAMVRLNDTDGTTPALLIHAGPKGSKVYSINAFNSDPTNPVVAELLVSNDGANYFPLVDVDILVNKSTNLIDVDVFKSCLQDGAYLLGPETRLYVRTKALPTASNYVSVVAAYADY